MTNSRSLKRMSHKCVNFEYLRTIRLGLRARAGVSPPITAVVSDTSLRARSFNGTRGTLYGRPALVKEACRHDPIAFVGQPGRGTGQGGRLAPGEGGRLRCQRAA